MPVGSPSDPLAVRVHTLDNGLQLWLSPNREEPRVACRLVVRAGAARDPEELSGVAHQLEHILANKGGRELGRGEVKQLYALMGGKGLNAYTSVDRTTYVVDLPAGRLPGWCAIEADRLGGPRLGAGFWTEMEVIREEKRRALDEPPRALREAFTEALWAGHPYGRPVLGTVEHLLAADPDALARFFSRWYAPSNVALVLAGDLDPDEVLRFVEDTIGARDDRPTSDEPPPPAPLVERGPVRVEHRGPVVARVGWRTVPAGHPDHEALRLARLLLGDGRTGLVERNLAQPQRVRGAAVRASHACFGGSMSVTVEPLDGQSADEAVVLATEQVDRLLQGEVDAGRLRAIVANARAAELRGQEENATRVALMGSAFVTRRTWDRVRGAVDRMAALSVDDVVEAARRWLGGTAVVAVRIPGEPTVPPMEVPAPARESLATAPTARFDEVLALPETPRAAQVLVCGEDYRRAETAAGLVLCNDNPFSDLGQVGLRWYSGSQGAPGLGTLLGLWGRAGVGDRSREQFEGELHDRAVTLATAAGRYHLDLVVRGPAAALPEVLELTARRLAGPTSTRADRRRRLEEVVARRVEAQTTRAFVTRTLAEYSRRGPDSAFLALRLPDEELLGLADVDLGRTFGRFVGLARTAVATGLAAATLKAALAPFVSGTVEEAALAPPIGLLRRAEPTVLLTHHAAAQATLILHVPADPWRRDTVLVRRMWSECVSGGAGIFFREVRELRGLAYSARAGIDSGWRQGDEDLVFARVGCDHDKVPEVARLMAALVPNPTIDVERFERCRRSAISKVDQGRVKFRQVGWTAERWRLRGLDEDPRPWLRAGLRELRLEDLQAYCARLARTPPTLCVVGDRSRLDVAALADLGVVTELGLEDLTV